MYRPLLFALTLLLAAGLSGCRTAAEADAPAESDPMSESAEPGALAALPGSPFEVSTDSTREEWEAGSAILIDVREPDEYEAGHIPGIPLIPMGQVAQRLDEIPEDQPVIFTCRSGRRSLEVATQLRKLGYENVYSQEGGILAWQEAGLAVEK